MASRYRFLLSARWAGMTVLGAVLITACVFLGIWQHGRYEDRAATNDRIEAADSDSTPVRVETVLAVDTDPDDDTVWTRVTATGVYDDDGRILIRNRSVDGQVGYELVVPLVLDDGTALLVDRGWIPPSDAGATALPEIPSSPSGEVTVTGQVRSSESRVGDTNEVDGVRQARSINVDQIAEALDTPVLGGYVTETEPADGFAAIPVVEERSWQNFAYAYQWWLFAIMIPIGLVVIARKEAKTPVTGPTATDGGNSDADEEPVAAAS